MALDSVLPAASLPNAAETHPSLSFRLEANSCAENLIPPGFRFAGTVDGYALYQFGPVVAFGSAPCRSIEDYILQFSGVGAIAIAIPQAPDNRPDHVLVFSDVYGLTDYFWTTDGQSVTVSREIASLVDDTTAIDEVSVFDLFFRGVVPFEFTAYSGVKKNMPLSYLRVGLRTHTSVEYRTVVPASDPTRTVQEFRESMEASLAVLGKHYANPLLYFSGGSDSTALLRVLPSGFQQFGAVHFHNVDNQLQEAYDRARQLVTLSVVQGTMAGRCRDLGRMPGAIHAGFRAFGQMAEHAQSHGHDCILTGQNADNVSQLGNTRIVTPRNILRNLLLHGTTGNVAKTYLTRTVTNHFEQVSRRLRRFYCDHILTYRGEEPGLSMLKVFASYCNSNPFYRDFASFGFLPESVHRRWWERLEANATLVNSLEGLSLRQKMLVLFSRCYIIAGDAKVIVTTGAAAGLPSWQVYTTPPVYRYFFNYRPPARDILKPKRTIREFANVRRAPAVSVESIVNDQQRVRRFAGRDVYPVNPEAPFEIELQELQSLFPWIHTGSLASVERYARPRENTISHIYGLVTKDFTPRLSP
ncbi:MAG: hypothetical protein ACK47B_00545 [Armatimonadota bacterium]